MSLKDLQILAGKTPTPAKPQEQIKLNPFAGSQQTNAQKKGSGFFSSMFDAVGKAGETIGNVGIGAAKSFIKVPQMAAAFGADIGLRGAAAVRGMDYEKLKAAQAGGFMDTATQRPEWTKAHGTAQEVGEFAGDVGQMLIPVGGGAKLAGMVGKAGEMAGTAAKAVGMGEKAVGTVVKAGELVTKAVGEGTKMALQTGAQTGSVEDAEQAFILGAAAPVVGAVAKGAGKLIGGKTGLAGRVIDSLIKPLEKDLRYGQNPGKTVAKMGIIGNTIEELTTNISKARDTVGKQIRAVIKKSTSNVPGGLSLNLEDIVKPFDDAMTEAAKGGAANEALVKRLKDAKDAVLNEHALDEAGNIVKGQARNLSTVSMDEALDIKQTISKMTKWTQNATDDKAVNSVLKRVYGDTSDKMVAAEPKLKPLNAKYADLVSAENATEHRAILNQRSNIVKLGMKTTTGATAILGGFLGGGVGVGIGIAGGIALEKALTEPATLTRLAAWLAKAPAAEKQEMFKAYPAVLRAAQKLILSTPEEQQK